MVVAVSLGVRSWLPVLLALAACDGGGPGVGADAAPPADAPPAGQGSEPRGEVVVNEVAAAADWIELANRGDTPVDLAGWFVSDAADRLDHYYAFPAGTTLGPGEYLIVWTDDGAPGEGHHAPFGLARADGVFLLDPDGIAADALLYLAPEDGRALARRPDREGLFFPAAPTPGGANP